MSEHRKPVAEAKEPIACKSAACGLPLQAAVSFCPYCGHLQVDTLVEQARAACAVASRGSAAPVQGREGPASGEGPSAANSGAELAENVTGDKASTGNRPISSAASTPAPPPADPASAAADRRPPREARDAAPSVPIASIETHTSSPETDPVSVSKLWRSVLRRGIYLVITSAVGLMVFAWWAGSSNARKVQECESLSAQASTAIAVGELVAAADAVQKGFSICEGERLKALRPLSARIEQERFAQNVCEQAEAQAQTLLEGTQPGRAVAMLSNSQKACGARSSYRDLMRRSDAATNEAKKLLADAQSRLDAHAYDEADSFLDSALQRDADVAGSDRLRRSIAAARADMIARRRAPTPLLPVPSIAQVPLAAPVISDVVTALVQDGQRALQQKNYALAKTHAQSALRIDSNHRVARSLLQQAEQAEQAALKGMNIE